MYRLKSQKGFSQILTVFLLVIGLGVLLVVAQNPTNPIPFAAGPNKTNQATSSANRRDQRTVNLSAYQSPMPISADSKISCIYSNPLVDSGKPQTTNNRFCPTNWTCAPTDQGFAGIRYGVCAPPPNYVTAPLPCSVSANVISGKSSGPNASNPSCPWRWACVDGACAAPTGLNLTSHPQSAQTVCSPDPNNIQSNCPPNFECVPNGSSSFDANGTPTPGGVCYGPTQ